MAVSQIQVKVVDVLGTSTTVQFTVAPTAANLLTAGIRAGGVFQSTVSDDNSNAWTVIDGAPLDELTTLYAPNLAVTPHANPTFTVSSPSNGANSLRGSIEEYSGAATTGVLLDHAGVASGGSSATPSIATTAGGAAATGDGVVGWVTNSGGNAITTGSTYTAGGGTAKFQSEWKQASGSGNQTADFTFGATDFYNIAIAVFAGVVGPAPAFSDTSLGHLGAKSVMAATTTSAGHQLAYPIADVSNAGLWTNESGASSPLYPSIAEVAYDDTTYLQSPIAPVNAPVVQRLGIPFAPGAGGLTIHIRLGKDFPGGEAINQTVDIMQGANVLQTWTFTDVPSGEIQQDLTITPGVVTDWTTALDVRITSNQA